MLIGLVCPAGMGKDTAGNYLVEEWHFTRLAFGDYIYKEVSEKYSIPENILRDRSTRECPNDGLNGLSPRQALQKHGQERRNEDPDYWVKKLSGLIDVKKDTVITDVRFNNEKDLIKSYGGYIIKIVPVGFVSTLSESTKNDISETQMIDMDADIYIKNIYGCTTSLICRLSYFVYQQLVKEE